jgi:hypothetical protein
VIRLVGLGRLDLLKYGEPLVVPPAKGDQLQLAFLRIFELRLNYGRQGYEEHQQIRLQVST